MDKHIYNSLKKLLHNELLPAMGCTEPIAVAYAGAKAKQVLSAEPEHCCVSCSGNIVKNVKGVVVPKSEGLRGIGIAAILGIVGGNAEDKLDVLKDVTHEDSLKAKELLNAGFCECELVEDVASLYLVVELTSGTNSSLVEISNYHTNITRIEKNGEVIFQKDKVREGEKEELKEQLSLKSIIDFADELIISDVESILDQQIKYNLAIAKEGLTGTWGAQIGKTMLGKPYGDALDIKATALAAAGSDARMGGCALPVVINSGSGNQGMAVSLPVYSYANELNVSHEDLIRALTVSNLLSLHQKKYIGSLSAYCGATSAACGAACGIAYMLCAEKIRKKELKKEERYQILCKIITNTICTIGGMVCDGAKSSCAAKIASAVYTALMAMDMSLNNRFFQAGEGMVMEDVEDTIAAVGRMGRVGMKSTDVEILNIMLGY